MFLITRGLGGGPILLAGLGGGSGPGPTVYPDLWAALEAWVPAHVTALTGGFWGYRAGGGYGFPYAEYDDQGGADQAYDSSATATGDGAFSIAVYATSKAQANSLAKAIRDAVNDAPLSFSDGSLLMLRAKSRFGGSLDPDPGPLGEPVYQSILMFRYVLDA